MRAGSVERRVAVVSVHGDDDLRQQRIQPPRGALGQAAPRRTVAQRPQRGVMDIDRLDGRAAVRTAVRAVGRGARRGARRAARRADGGRGTRSSGGFRRLAGRDAYPLALEQRIEARRHGGAVPVQRVPGGIEIRRAEQHGDAGAPNGLLRQHVRLRVVDRLQRVLDPAQLPVRALQDRHVVGRHDPARAELPQHRQQRTPRQRGLAPTAHELVRLHDELHLADAAAAELDVVVEGTRCRARCRARCRVRRRRRDVPAPRGTGLAPDVARGRRRGDHRLQLAQGRHDRVVRVAAIDERQPQRLEGADIRRGAGQRACLDHRVALPVAAVLAPVRIQRDEARDGRAAVAERAQPDVGAKADPVDGARGQQPQRLAERAREPLARRQGARTVAVAAGRVQRDQVHVRGHVQLLAAELAHRDDHRIDRIAGGVPNHPVPPRGACGRTAPGHAHARVGERRQRAKGPLQRRAVHRRVPDDAELLGMAQVPQRGERRSIVARLHGQRCDPPLQHVFQRRVARGHVGVGIEGTLVHHSADGRLAPHAQVRQVRAAGQGARRRAEQCRPIGAGARERPERLFQRRTGQRGRQLVGREWSGHR